MKPEKIVQLLLGTIDPNPNRSGLLETPVRVARANQYIFSGYDKKPEDVIKVFDPDDDNITFRQMVMLRNVEFFSTCEHHMLPFFGRAHIAYIPSENGKVIGASKLVRILEIYARRLQIQERIGEQVTEALMTHLNATGAGCIIEAQHFCMMARGVEKQHSEMVTSSLKGSILEEPQVRAEFLSLALR